VLLAPTARIQTQPQLEIYADDVKCSHGATVGQMNEEQIYYMRQRGLSEEAARKLQLGGFVREILDKIDDEALRAEFEQKLKISE
jgi:Fe-S cluster assembly protein SufD